MNTVPDESNDRLVAAQAVCERIRTFVESRRDRLIADSSRIIQFQTVSGGTPEQQAEYERQIPACFEWLGGLVRGMGFEFRVIQGVVGEVLWRNSDPSVPTMGIASHIDVVTPMGEWTHGPFSGEIAGGYLWGRGVQDDKGPLIQVLHALHAVKSCGFQPPCHIKVIIGTLEETSRWSDLEIYKDTVGAPEFGFTPDADFPIINGEKGMVSLAFKAAWPESGVHHDTGIEFVSLAGGERENIVPSWCELTLRFPSSDKTGVMKELVRTTTEFVVENHGANITLAPNREREVGDGRYEAVVSFVGRAAHSSTPEKGHNAILDALHFVRDIETLPEPMRRFAAFLHMAASDLSGDNLGIASSHDFIGATSVSLSLIDLRAKGGEALLNVRPTMGLSCAEVLLCCRDTTEAFAAASGLDVSVRVAGTAKEAIHLDPENPEVAPFIKSLQQGYELVTGNSAGLQATAGTTYAKAFPNFCAFGPVIVPTDLELAHEVDERFLVESIVRNACIYGTSIALMAQNHAG
ncbi:Sapep family Mn(2+)-dependent dipeptidase [Candidatus Poribacteria bacterium]|nr:Sapep family Mn(2+)-dependent dipeptidase [Candidatus Poribacteria bacterium]